MRPVNITCFVCSCYILLRHVPVTHPFVCQHLKSQPAFKAHLYAKVPEGIHLVCLVHYSSKFWHIFSVIKSNVQTNCVVFYPLY